MSTNHPYREHEGSALWKILDRGLSELEQNRDLTITTAREYVVGYLCSQLSPRDTPSPLRTDSREARARQIQESIRSILLRDWDPIGVKDEPEAQDEYDGYVGGVYRLLASGASTNQIADHLANIEVSSMGFTTEAAKFLPIAARLRKLDVR